MNIFDACEQAYKNGYENGKRDAMKWISVSEKLPKGGEIVLVCGSRGGVYTAVFNKPGQYKGWHKLNSKIHYCDPTHWMPLPEPPEEICADG